MRLPDPQRSYAVLIGASTYQSTDLPDLPAVRNNLDGMVAALTDPRCGGFVRERCGIAGDTAITRGTYRLLREYAAKAEDTFLVYFAGHGLTGELRHDLYLTLSDTDPEELPVSALSFDMIRDIFQECPARNRVLILDCCFSGRATAGFMGAHRHKVLGQVEISGTYTLAATPANAVALAPAGATYTAFTGELLTLLEHGIPDGPELLSLGTIYQVLHRRLTAEGLPKPGQRGTDTADQLALTRNPAHQREPVAEPDGPPRGRKVLLAIAVVVFVAAAAVSVWLVIKPDANSVKPSDPPLTPTTSSSTTAGVVPPPPVLTDTSTAITGPPASAGRYPYVSVRVYNNSNIPDLADRAANDFRNAGWTIETSGNYAEPIAVTTVYYRPKTTEESTAIALANEFGLRYDRRFEGIKDAPPGVIVIVTKEYIPKN
ncbi:caspase, EACC1-associated type [Actinocrispum wychmicini]|uniref:Caspase domain-containing protein n=1 Tax=Actinocrispum wychmicini TaxID=1213861 RepID=A0A4R2JGC7_9PSEU|nr:LytR C-terminal domain-containing protein [Actinocrispum wychmicini]TCO58074.1 caspase domain-containing protein [Actinocrispum wychmicini]